MKAYISMIIAAVISVCAMSSYAEPAIVGDGDECYITLDLPGLGEFGFLGDKVQGVSAVSGNEATPFAPGKITCQGHTDFGLERAYVQRAPCVVFGVPDFGNLFTEDGMIAVTPSGKWSAQCHFRKAKGH